MNKKAQLDNPIIIFAIVVIGLLLVAPIGLKILRDIQEPVANSFGNMTDKGGGIAKENFNTVIVTGINFWDKIIVAFFIFAVLLLLVSAFLVDAHPFWVVLYILTGMFLVVFSGNMIEAVDHIYDSSTFAEETAMLSFLDTIRIYYGEFLVGMMVLTGIIIYGKLSFFSGRPKR